MINGKLIGRFTVARSSDLKIKSGILLQIKLLLQKWLGIVPVIHLEFDLFKSGSE